MRENTDRQEAGSAGKRCGRSSCTRGLKNYMALLVSFQSSSANWDSVT